MGNCRTGIGEAGRLDGLQVDKLMSGKGSKTTHIFHGDEYCVGFSL